MIGGRSAWIAWPAGLVCAGVVAGLVWLAAPGVPAAVQLAGGLLRAGSTAAQSPADPQGPAVDTGSIADCRALYPDGLWTRLSWDSHVVLDQAQTAPSTSATAVRDALQPDVRVSCTWRDGTARTIATTLSRVDAAADAIAADAFSAQGFTCTASGAGARCTRTSGDTLETDVVRDGVWLSTTERAWHPDGYTDQLIRRLWP